jgi:hypothetical protein
MTTRSFGARFLCAAVASSFIITGCATQLGPDGRPLPQTALQRSIGTCVAAVGIGLMVDLLASKHKRPGAGTLVGAGICAVVMIVNNEEDKQRIRESQMAALNSGKSRHDSYVGANGDKRYINTVVTDEKPPLQMASYQLSGGDQFVGPCRRSQTSIEVGDKGSAALDPDVYCRTAQGNWISPTTGLSI